MNIRPQVKIINLALLLLFAAGCKSETESTQPLTASTAAGTSAAPPASEVGQRNNGLARFIHAVPAMAATDLFVDDTKAFSNVTYKTITPYAEFPAARHIFRLRVAGQDSAQPLIEEDESLNKCGHHTVVALPSAGTAIIARNDGTSLLFIADKIETPTAGKAKIRVVHAVPDLGALDIYLTGRSEALLESIDFGASSNYTEIEPFSGSLEVKRAGENVTTLSVPQMNIVAGKSYTVFVMGRTKGTANLEALSVEDFLGAKPPQG
ncbi:MAG: DUF4397 domain-containing protein [Pyrinomonadaceae bacterium]